MLELMNSYGKVTLGITGPGPQTLLKSTAGAGFFGELPATELINGDALASAIGLSSGTSVNSASPWLKFALDDKILFVAKHPLRSGISWGQLYEVGAVYGDDTTGLFPSGSTVLQNKKVTVGEFQFRVRLLKGANTDPFTGERGENTPGTHGSEWNRLMYPIVNDAPGNDAPERWANYNLIDLIPNAAQGGYSWTQERDPVTSNYRIFRNSITTVSFDSTTQTNTYRGWRPCLELIP